MKAKYLDRQFPAEYAVWRNMIQRCTNPKSQRYDRYGGRGIKVCQEWRLFANFLADMGRRPDKGYSIERKNNDDDYKQSNCKWATRDEQENNKSSSVKLTYNGKTLTLTQWARGTGMTYDTVRARYRYGWSAEKILTAPANKYTKDRRHNNRSNLITYNGKTLSVTEWAKELGVSYDVIRSRVRYGWDVERILTTPVDKKKT